MSVCGQKSGYKLISISLLGDLSVAVRLTFLFSNVTLSDSDDSFAPESGAEDQDVREE